MESFWYDLSSSQFIGILATSVGLYMFLLILVRFMGLRSFSKMSAHDFAVTVAIGSILATTVVSATPALLPGALGMTCLLGLKKAFSYIRVFWPGMPIDNKPILLMEQGKFLTENMRRAEVTKDDVRAKLREANVLQYDKVRAVIMESTGDVSVLHGDDNVDADLLDDVIRNGDPRFSQG